MSPSCNFHMWQTNRFRKMCLNKEDSFQHLPKNYPVRAAHIHKTFIWNSSLELKCGIHSDPNTTCLQVWNTYLIQHITCMISFHNGNVRTWWSDAFRLCQDKPDTATANLTLYTFRPINSNSTWLIRTLHVLILRSVQATVRRCQHPIIQNWKIPFIEWPDNNGFIQHFT